MGPVLVVVWELVVLRAEAKFYPGKLRRSSYLQRAVEIILVR